MWLCDSLPDDLPNARIMLYGYDTEVAGSHSFQKLEDLASTLRSTIQTLVLEEEVQQRHRTRPIVFVAYSLGGLVFKEALIQMNSDKNSCNLLGSICGALFFGVPSQGMDISHLLPMVEGQPNEDLIRSLSVESAFLYKQSRDFPKAFDFHDSEIVCFYETLKSPTAMEDCLCCLSADLFQYNGKWQMSGPSTILVSNFSATRSRPHEIEPQNAHPINKTHSDKVH